MKNRNNSIIENSFFVVILLMILECTLFFSFALSGEPPPDITLVLTGDIMTERRVGKEIIKRSDTYFPFRSMGEFTKKGDITFGNLETTISTRGERVDKYCTFRAAPNTMKGIKKAGFDILTLANNHICDYGMDATKDTMDYIHEQGMEHVGLWFLDQEAADATIPRPIVKETKGIRFAFLGYGENLLPSFRATATKAAPVPTQESVMRSDIKYARSIADVVVVAIHWRRLPQYVLEADEGQIEMCHKLCDWGADILANHGPHTLQETEVYNGSLIFYSLGNIAFSQNEPNTHFSMIAMVHLKGSKLDRMELIPLRRNDFFQYIPKGNILKMKIQNGLWLNWDDYNTLMFSSQEPLTNYKEPEKTLFDRLKELKINTKSVVSVIAILLLLILGFAFKKCKGRNP
jgi:poly-gamma-glutamate synthesis protein (capsule biosynthesis protein)